MGLMSLAVISIYSNPDSSDFFLLLAWSASLFTVRKYLFRGFSIFFFFCLDRISRGNERVSSLSETLICLAYELYLIPYVCMATNNLLLNIPLR